MLLYTVKNKVLEMRELPYQLRDEGIGSYEARGLLISLGRRQIRVEPIAEMSRVHSRRPVLSTSVERTGEWI